MVKIEQTVRVQTENCKLVKISGRMKEKVNLAIRERNRRKKIETSAIRIEVRLVHKTKNLRKESDGKKQIETRQV